MVARFTDCSGIEVMPNATVSPTPGKGDYLSLSDAVKNIPSNAEGRYVIYVKAGIYNENVLISRSSVSLIGDGIGRTIIRSSRSRLGTGHTIQDSGAVMVVADKFNARCITFENVSGAENEQAVALRSQGDQSVFYRCEFLGHQDTLYVNGSMKKDPSGRNAVIGRQFFRECDIYGTVDFVFGDAQMVLQKCCIKFRTPRIGGRNVITAQGRTNKNSNTGIVLHCCSITAAGDFKVGSQKGYLGRTWQKYSRTVVMNSFIDDVVEPAGWLEMNGNAQTADYSEYNNCGPGSSTTNRVRWPGYKAIKNPKDLMPYTVETFIDGSSWLPATNVPFNLRLSCSS